MSSVMWNSSAPSPSSELGAELGFHLSCAGVSNPASCILLFSSGNLVGTSHEIAGTGDTGGSVVMVNEGFGSAGPPHPSWRFLPISVASFSSGDGFFGVGMAVP